MSTVTSMVETLHKSGTVNDTSQGHRLSDIISVARNHLWGISSLYDSQSCSSFLPTLGMVSLFHSSSSGVFLEVFLCGFIFHVPSEVSHLSSFSPVWISSFACAYSRLLPTFPFICLSFSCCSAVLHTICMRVICETACSHSVACLFSL